MWGAEVLNRRDPGPARARIGDRHTRYDHVWPDSDDQTHQAVEAELGGIQVVPEAEALLGGSHSGG